MDNKRVLNIVTLIILIAVPFLKFFSMCLEHFGIMNNYDNINPAIILYISLPVLIYIYVSDIKKKRRKLNIYDFIVYGITLISILSTLFSIDKNIAIFGKDFRHEGLLSVLSYLYLFLNWHINGNIKDAKKYIKLIVVISVLNSAYSLFQIYTSFDFIVRYKDHLNLTMASGMIGNPNFLGSLIVTSLSILTYSFFGDDNDLTKKALLIILLFISLINCQSTGPMLTYIIVVLFLVFYLLKNKVFNIKRFIYIALLLSFTFIFINRINAIFNNDFSISNKNGELSISNKSDELSVKGIKETFKSGGNGRITIWKNSLNIFKKHPWLGVGYDNFYLAYPNEEFNGMTLSIVSGEVKIINDSVLIFDNAHNVYLHQLISCGIFGSILFLILYVLVFISALKSKNVINFILLGGFIAYSIQGFANINVIQITPIYYLIMGLILCLNKEN